MGWFTGKAIFGLARWIWGLIVLVAVILAIWWLYSAITAKPKAEARLGKNTTEAALQSGADAVDTAGKQATAESAIDRITKGNADDIRNAEGADAPVAAGADAAGREALCRRAAYRDDPRCVRR